MSDPLRTVASAPAAVLAEAAAIVVLAVATSVVYWPALSADWIRDDYLVLAFSRMLDSPWRLFVDDHFHAPGSHFRPLAYATFWLSQAALGNGHAAQAAVEGAIHVAVVATLYALMRRAVARGPALACALLFGVHPAVVSAAAWYSDRSGHLALLFTLVAAAVALGKPAAARGRVAFVLAAVFAAMLSKELGLVAVPIVASLWWFTLPAGRARLLALTALALTTLLFLAWRAWVLGTLLSNATGGAPLLDVLTRGIAVWARHFVDYATLWPNVGAGSRTAVIAGSILAAGLLVAGLRRCWGSLAQERPSLVLVTAALLVVGPGVLQAPIAAQNALPLTQQLSAVEFAMQARLYYSTLAGVALALAVLLGAAWPTRGERHRASVATGVAGLCLVAMVTGWRSMDAYRDRAMAIGSIAHRAVAALDARALPARDCRIVYAGVVPPPEWDVFVSMDQVVKALAPDLGRVAHCLVRADYETFVDLLPAPAADAFARTIPARPGPDGRPLAPRRIGGLVMAYFPTLPTPPMRTGALAVDLRELR